MREAVKGYLALAGSLTEVTRQRATAAARALVAQGEATAEQVTSLVDDLIAQTRQNREAVSALVTYEVDRTLGRIGLASGDEVSDLVERVRSLEAEVRRLSAALEASGGGAATSAPTKSAPAKSAPTKSAPTKSPAAKSPAVKKTPAKKAANKAAGSPRAGA